VGKPNASKKKGQLSWIELALLGLGFTTGVGFFLGSSIAIEKAGFGVLLLFFLAAVGTYLVYNALAKMISQYPGKGTFKDYSKAAFGHWAGFCHGYIYWLSEMLVLGSTLTALGLFTKFWFKEVPLWIFAGGYALLGIGVVLLGRKGFEKVENVLAVLKMTALLAFIVLGFLTVTGVLGKANAHMHTPDSVNEFFRHGAMGMWTAFIFAFFAFAGIEVMGLMATNLKNPKDAPKSGTLMLAVITVLYLGGLGFALVMAHPKDFGANESPFISAFKDVHYETSINIFNGVLIAAGFSSLVASLFSTSQVMVQIAKTGDAPKLFAKASKRNIPYPSLALTACGMGLSVLAALLLPKSVFEYIVTAGGLMLVYSWLFMVAAAMKLLKLSVWGKTAAVMAMALILIATIGTLFDKASRPGFFFSLGLLLAIGAVAFFMRNRWKKQGGGGSGQASRATEEDEDEDKIDHKVPFRQKDKAF